LLFYIKRADQIMGRVWNWMGHRGPCVEYEMSC